MEDSHDSDDRKIEGLLEFTDIYLMFSFAQVKYFVLLLY